MPSSGRSASAVEVCDRLEAAVKVRGGSPGRKAAEEKSASSGDVSMTRSSKQSAQDFSDSVAVQQLEELQVLERKLTSIKAAPYNKTAAIKWAQATKVAEEGRSLELWCSGSENLSGTYLYSPAESYSRGPPVFQKELHPQRWLYVAINGAWFVGDSAAREKRTPKGWMRSRSPVEPGRLPHTVDVWEVPRSGEWESHETAKFWLSESVAVAWQQLRVTCFQNPVVEVRGVEDAFADGFFDFVHTDGSAGEPPAFQHQQRPNLWLFLAPDQRWWIGNSTAKYQNEDRGLLHSAPVQPGTHPSEAAGWHVRNTKVWEECKGLKIRVPPGELRAEEKWERARSRADRVQIWGKDCYHGEYVLEATEDGIPVYRFVEDENIWLYLAMDGAWWLSDEESKVNGKRARGFMRSTTVEPGTLPQDVLRWEERHNGSWRATPQVRVLVPEAVEELWRAGWQAAAENPVIEVEGVVGPSFNGMYDLVDARESKYPAYRNQVNEDLFLYVGVDGRYWLSTENHMCERSASGRMHSNPILPGMLPDREKLSWYVYNKSCREWEKQASVAVS